MRETEKERRRPRQRERQAPYREPDVWNPIPVLQDRALSQRQTCSTADPPRHPYFVKLIVKSRQKKKKKV